MTPQAIASRGCSLEIFKKRAHGSREPLPNGAPPSAPGAAGGAPPPEFLPGELLSDYLLDYSVAGGVAIGRNPAGTPAAGRVCCGSGGLRRFVEVVLRCCRGSAEKGVAANPWRFAVAAEIVAVEFRVWSPESPKIPTGGAVCPSAQVV